MSYKIEIHRSAFKKLQSIPTKEVKKIYMQINHLMTEPIPKQSVKIKGEQNIYRLRIGNYRIVYEVKKLCLSVLVLIIDHRKNVYKQL